MLRVKSFSGEIGECRSVTLDLKINSFLEKTNVKIIDIKFSAVMNGGGTSAAAMVLYDEPRREGES